MHPLLHCLFSASLTECQSKASLCISLHFLAFLHTITSFLLSLQLHSRMVNGKDVSRHEVHMADRLLDTHREANQSDSLSAGQSSFWGNKSVRESAR